MKAEMPNMPGQGAITEQDRIEVTSQVFKALVANAREGGTFRHLIYDRLGFSGAAYIPLYNAGGLLIADSFVLTDNMGQDMPDALVELEALASAAPMEQHPTLKRNDGTPVPWPTTERTQLFSALYCAQALVESNQALVEANRRLSSQCEQLEQALEQQNADKKAAP